MPLKILGHAGWKITNATLSPFAVLISYLLTYIQLMVSKLNRDHDVIGRNFCLGYPHILPYVMLDISTFSVVLTDFSEPYLIGSKNSFSLRCLPEHTGVLLQFPFISPNAAITIHCPSGPSFLPLAVPAHLLLQQSHSAQPTGPATHICKATHASVLMWREFVQLRPKKV